MSEKLTKSRMYDMLYKRMNILLKRYQKALVCQDEFGNDLTKGNAAAVRTQTKRDVQLIVLVTKLLDSVASIELVDRDAIEGFNRLVQPLERYRRYR